MSEKTLNDLAEILGGEVLGDGNIPIRGVAGIREAGPGDLTFLAHERYETYLEQTKGSAVLIERPRPGLPLSQLVHPNPYLAYLKALAIYRPAAPRPTPGIHPSATVAQDAHVGHEVTLGPGVVIESGAHVGDRSVLIANVYIGRETRIGNDVVLHPGVVVHEECRVGDRTTIHSGTVIGADGFGYVRDGRTYHKVPQVGNVEIGEDVEIGSNVCVDRAVTGTTVVGTGTKIDNLVQVGHNVRIGENAIIIAQVGISGSTEVGDGVTLAGQAGIGGHLKIGENAIIGAQSGVTKSVPPNTQVSGYPAQPHSLARRIQVLTHRLPQMVKMLKQMDQRLHAIEAEFTETELATENWPKDSLNIKRRG